MSIQLQFIYPYDDKEELGLELLNELVKDYNLWLIARCSEYGRKIRGDELYRRFLYVQYIVNYENDNLDGNYSSQVFEDLKLLENVLSEYYVHYVPTV